MEHLNQSIGLSCKVELCQNLEQGGITPSRDDIIMIFNVIKNSYPNSSKS